MVVGRYGIACGSEFYVYGSFDNHFFPSFQAACNLGIFPVCGTKAHLLFVIRVSTLVYIDVVYPLFLCKCRCGHADNVMAFSYNEKHLGIGTRYDIAAIVKLKRHGNV